MNSRILYPGDGATRLFQITFPYLNRTHVKVYVNKVLQYAPGDYRFVSTGALEFTNAPRQDDAVEIIRQTELAASLAQFQNGSVLTEDELNLATLQNLYLNQELRDYISAVLDPGLVRIGTAAGVTGATAGEVIDNIVASILDSELLALLQQRVTDIDNISDTVSDQVLRLNTVEELVEALASVDGQSIATFLLNEQSARIAGDVALAQDISLIGAKSGDGLAFILDLAKVRVSPTESLGTRLSGLQASLGANTAAIVNEQTVRANADTALSNTLSSLSATVGNNTAAILTEQTARANADSALSSQITTLQATTGANTAAIQNEVTARTSADSALASSVSTLQSTVNGNTASIQTQQTVINGLSAQYSVKLDVNGYVTGFGLYNSGSSSEFLVLADRFAVVSPGASPVVPFAVDANGVYINNAYIRNLTVDRIIGGNIGAQWNINNSSGRIVLETATHMKVLGVGFGANADLIEWFGTKRAINTCTKANAVTYISTNGDAYFGGTLSAGVLKNAAQSTQVSKTASVSTGTFGSNGGTRVVVVSFSFTHYVPLTGNQMGTFPRNLSTRVTLRRSGTQLQQQTINGSYVGGYYDSETNTTYVDAFFSGSFTFTDTSGGTSVEYSAELDSSTGQWPITPSTGVQQRLSLISTEE